MKKRKKREEKGRGGIGGGRREYDRWVFPYISRQCNRERQIYVPRGIREINIFSDESCRDMGRKRKCADGGERKVRKEGG